MLVERTFHYSEIRIASPVDLCGFFQSERYFQHCAAEIRSAFAPAAPIEQYVVQAGDTLSRIAGKVYGDVSPASWERIFEANRDGIGDNPSRINVGMELAIPR